jgi:protein-S-isoprenylcysteine O-methyltransferase Ste14
MDSEEASENQENDLEPSGITPRMWIRTILVLVALPAIILFAPAGTFNWPMAWLYIGLSLVSFAISRTIIWRKNPDLLAERGRMMDHQDTASFDRWLAPLLALVGPTLIGLVAGFAIRFDWTPSFPGWLSWFGVLLFIVSTIFGSWAVVVNRFFSGVVRIQVDRGHHVVSSGPYAIVRHPGYLGAGIAYLGMVLMLGSPWAFIPYFLQLAVLIARTALEDRMLQAKLPGYNEYAQQTRYRLIPGIW